MGKEQGGGESQGRRERKPGARRGSAHGEAKATLELVLSAIQEGPEGQRQRQGRELLLRGTHDPIAVHGTFEKGLALGKSSRYPKEILVF